MPSDHTCKAKEVRGFYCGDLGKERSSSSLRIRGGGDLYAYNLEEGGISSSPSWWVRGGRSGVSWPGTIKKRGKEGLLREVKGHERGASRKATQKPRSPPRSKKRRKKHLRWLRMRGGRGKSKENLAKGEAGRDEFF